jgi:single-stranded-DNA-specific exonuclease
MIYDQELQGEKYVWYQKSHDTHTIVNLAQRYNVMPSVIETLATRGMTTAESIDEFLFAPVEQIISDSRLMQDAEKAVERIERAIAAQEKILIAGDYDVDGVTSSALMLACLMPLGAQVNFFLPHRQRDGYGLSVRTIQRAVASGYTLVITVDNGITAYEPALEAKKLGIDLIITDHHRPHAELPEAYAVVDPHRTDCNYPFKYFAGVGISFKLMSLLYQRQGKQLPDKVYELLMLGTIADVVPLIGENRYWVRHGLQCVNLVESMALKLLKENARFVKPKLSSRDVGFYLAPQINALGRLDDARSAVMFLLGTQLDQMTPIATRLAELNATRRTIESSVVQDIVKTIEAGELDLKEQAVLIAGNRGWPAGVIGLAASRLVGLYSRPAIVLHLTDDGIAKGSCRSIPEVNIFELLEQVSDLLISFGGHPMAAGLSMPAENIPLLRARLHEVLQSRIDVTALKQRIYVDADLTLPDVTKRLMHDIAQLEPFGASHQEPLFHIRNVNLVNEPQLLKELHVKGMIFADGVLKPVIFFNRPELYQRFLRHGLEPFSLAATVTENHWNGKTTIEFCGTDVAGLAP